MTAAEPMATVGLVPRFAKFDASALRPASTATRLDWLSSSVALLHISADGLVTQATTPPQKRRLLDDATTRDLVLVAWKGSRAWRSCSSTTCGTRAPL